MKKQLNKILILFIIPIITGIISGVITAKIQNINFFSAIIVIFKTIFNFAKYLLLFKIPIWIILTLLFLAFIAKKTIIFIKIKNDNNNDSTKKTIENELQEKYVEDKFDGITYRWEWYESHEGPKITKLHPICECGCEFAYSGFDYYIECPDCKKQYENTIDEDSAKKVFKNRYRKKLAKLKDNRL